MNVNQQAGGGSTPPMHQLQQLLAAPQQGAGVAVDGAAPSVMTTPPVSTRGASSAHAADAPLDLTGDSQWPASASSAPAPRSVSVSACDSSPCIFSPPFPATPHMRLRSVILILMGYTSRPRGEAVDNCRKKSVLGTSTTAFIVCGAMYEIFVFLLFMEKKRLYCVLLRHSGSKHVGLVSVGYVSID